MAERVSEAWVKSRTALCAAAPRPPETVLELTQASEKNGLHAINGQLSSCRPARDQAKFANISRVGNAIWRALLMTLARLIALLIVVPLMIGATITPLVGGWFVFQTIRRRVGGNVALVKLIDRLTWMSIGGAGLMGVFLVGTVLASLLHHA
jgi:hypothetical protein